VLYTTPFFTTTLCLEEIPASHDSNQVAGMGWIVFDLTPQAMDVHIEAAIGNRPSGFCRDGSYELCALEKAARRGHQRLENGALHRRERLYTILGVKAAFARLEDEGADAHRRFHEPAGRAM
jgi:hypothetical protein